MTRAFHPSRLLLSAAAVLLLLFCVRSASARPSTTRSSLTIDALDLISSSAQWYSAYIASSPLPPAVVPTPSSPFPAPKVDPSTEKNEFEI